MMDRFEQPSAFVSNPVLQAVFMKFLKSEFNEENLVFFLKIEKYRKEFDSYVEADKNGTGEKSKNRNQVGQGVSGDNNREGEDMTLEMETFGHEEGSKRNEDEMDEGMLMKETRYLMQTFIVDSAPYKLNVEHEMVRLVKEQFDADDIRSTMFDECQGEVKKLLFMDAFPRLKEFYRKHKQQFIDDIHGVNATTGTGK
eukprot:TRINITY_DN15053_c0_g1_i1.p2 TRINITY_DN15053_c0_g1~~TRINITY_DN15053_c0_g1_i1.p2  ORF type:complete len:198 (-),score=75.17 TRINITY_DN15053_c0_g1_i1:18-611(-)